MSGHTRGTPATLEVLAECATFDITAPATGKLLHKEAFSREFLTPGQVLGMIEGE